MFFKKDEFIIESKPIRTVVDDNLLIQVSEHINNGCEDGLTESEIQTLLDWVVENTRRNIEKYTGQDITDNDLMGLCGFAQTSSLTPLENHFKETYNSTTDFNTPDIKYVVNDLRHAFGTITFPLKTENGVVEKQYLVDVTFRQFFKRIMCENPTYSLTGTFEMDPGYFLCNKIRKTKESIHLSKQLLKKGYVELTDENLKLYIDSFIYSSIYRTNQDYLHDMKKLDIDFYKKRLRRMKPAEQEFDERQLLRCNSITRMPYLNSKIKTR